MREQKRKTLTFTAVILTGALLLAGCVSVDPEPARAPDVQVETTPEKYEGGAGSSLTSVESSLLLSEKYAALAVESEKIRQENKRLSELNIELATQNAKLQAELEQTSKELKEANAMLIDMRVEINNWKNSVLGFRDEMRAAQKAQLEAMVRIMQLLGGESQKEGASNQTSQGDPNSKK